MEKRLPRQNSSPDMWVHDASSGEKVAALSYGYEVSDPDAVAERLAADLELLRDLGQLAGSYEIRRQNNNLVTNNCYPASGDEAVSPLGNVWYNYPHKS